jgi:hypothetical protein
VTIRNWNFMRRSLKFEHSIGDRVVVNCIAELGSDMIRLDVCQLRLSHLA